MIDLTGVYQHAKFLGLCCYCSVITKVSKFLNVIFLTFYLSEHFLMSKNWAQELSNDTCFMVIALISQEIWTWEFFRVCGKLKTLENHNSEPPRQIKKNFVPNFPFMTTTHSQNFREIHEINLKLCIFFGYIQHGISLFAFSFEISEILKAHSSGTETDINKR